MIARILAVIAVGLIWHFGAYGAVAQQCVGDADGNNEVSIDELVIAVGNSLEGCGAEAGLVAVSGSVSGEAGTDAFRIWATGDSGMLRYAETGPGGDFTLLLPADDWYVLGFGHYHGHAEMHFAGNMVFECGGVEEDHFYVGPADHSIDLGEVIVADDGSFARPEHDPLDQLDYDGDTVPDRDDPDMDCHDIGDHDHDGFYDDDMDHDGFHDDDVDHDGHHDADHHHDDGGHHGTMHTQNSSVYE